MRKRFWAVLSLALMILVLSVAAASADTLLQTNLFEVAVSSSWTVKKAQDQSVQSERRENETLAETVGLFEIQDSHWPTDPSELAQTLIGHLGLKSVGELEEIEIDGRKTVLVPILKDEVCVGYATMIKTGSYHGVFYYMFNEPYGSKQAALNLMETLKVRPKSDFCYFRFGDAEVKYKGFRTKTVGRTKYLLVDFIWRNVGNSPDMFVVNVDVTAYQDGIQLYDGYLLTENTEVGTSIMPGKSLTVTEVFQMRENTGEITLIVDKLMDFTHEWQERQYSFKVE